jgi:hypothetical protein
MLGSMPVIEATNERKQECDEMLTSSPCDIGRGVVVDVVHFRAGARGVTG